MEKSLLEAFSDGVLATITTMMVLETKVPHGSDLAALKPALPVLLTCVLGFAYVRIYAFSQTGAGNRRFAGSEPP